MSIVTKIFDPFDWGVTGLAASLRKRVVKRSDGSSLQAVATGGFAETVSGSGTYCLSITTWDTTWGADYAVVVDDGAATPGHVLIIETSDDVRTNAASAVSQASAAATNSAATVAAVNNIPTTLFAFAISSTQTAGTFGEAILYTAQRFGRRNVAQGGTSATITLDAGASATDHTYENDLIKIYAGTGAGQFRTIVGYVGATKVATLDRAWTVTPDNTSGFFTQPQPVDNLASQTLVEIQKVPRIGQTMRHSRNGESVDVAIGAAT